jgi:hypothetical protein
MKARSKHPQLQRYTRNWATLEIMKTLIKNKWSYKKRIGSEDDDRDSFMKDGEELEGDGDEGREDEDGYEEELEEDGDEGRDKDKDEEGNEEENDDGDDGEENNEEGEDMYAEGENADKEERDDVDDPAVEQRAWDLEWEAAAGFGSTSQSAAAKKLKKSAATSKSGGKSEFKPASAAIGLAGTKRKLPEDEDQGTDQVAAVKGRRNPTRNLPKLKKLRL